MREVIHQHLFDPPRGTKAVVVPCCGEFWDHKLTKYTPMDVGYAYLAKARWKNLHICIGILQWRMGVTPHPLTATNGLEADGRIYVPGKNKTYLPNKYHLISLPTRKFKEERITVDFLCKQIRALRKLCEEIPWLKTGDIILPQICDGPDKPWAYWKPLIEPYLAPDRPKPKLHVDDPDPDPIALDRFVFISGKEGTIT